MPTRQEQAAVMLRMQVQQEVRASRALAKFLKKQAKDVASEYKNNGQSAAERIITEDSAKLYQTLVPIYSSAIKTFVQYLRSQLIEKKSDFQEYTQKYLKRYAADKVVMVSNTTRDKLNDSVLKGQQEGWGQNQTADHITQSLGGVIAENRAKVIARTEIHQASNYGMSEQAKDIHYGAMQLTKTWVATDDERTRNSHAEMNDQTVGLEDAFATPTGEYLYYPGDPDGAPEEVINCRCAVVYEPSASNFLEE